MNNPLNAPPSPNELVLRLIGGDRDGQMFTVHNEKCLLSGLLPKTDDAEMYRCAIFRGEKGVAFRSYSDHVLCNGAKVSVKWLKQGDLIKVTDSFSVEVIQLGVYSKSASETPAASVATNSIKTRSPSQTISLTPEEQPYENATPAKVDSVATHLASTAGSLSASAAEPPKFKPATNNLRTPSLTAPLATHQPLIPSSSSAARAPESTQAIDAAVAPVSADVVSETATLDTPADVDSAAPATMGSAIDSLTDRLSKLVDVASGAEEMPAVTSDSAIVEPKGNPATQVEIRDQNQVAVSPEMPSVPPVEVPANSVSNPAPVADAIDSGSPSTPDPQPSSSDDPASRRSALESFFAKSGVTISDAAPLEDAATSISNPASPAVSSIPVDAAVPQPPAVPDLRQDVVTEGIAKPSDFDLDSVLEKLEASSAKPVLDAIPTPEVSNVASDVTSSADGQTELQSLLASVATPDAPAATHSSSVVEAYLPPFEESPVSSESSVNEVQSAPLPSINDDETFKPEAVAAGSNDFTASTEDAEPIENSSDNPIKSFALLQSLGLDTTGLSDMKEELAQSPAPEELAAIVAPTDQTEEPEPVAKPAPVESVADVLARMQSGGSLDDFSMDEAPAEPEAQSETVSLPPVEDSISQPASAEVTEVPHDEEDGSVEDYMSQLLNRMRGEAEPTTGKVVTEKQDEAVEKIVAEEAVMEVKVAEPKIASTETLTKEEFIPKQKPVRMQSLDSLREIANSSAREAFRDSIARERTVSTQTKLKIALISLAFAVLFFAMSYLMQDKVNFWGVVCGVGFLIFGILTSRAYLSEKKLDESIISD